MVTMMDRFSSLVSEEWGPDRSHNDMLRSCRSRRGDKALLNSCPELL